LPNDIAEALSLHMHEQADGDQAAIIITYHGVGKTTQGRTPAPLIDEDEEDQGFQEPRQQVRKAPSALFSKIATTFFSIRLPFGSSNRHINMRLNHRKRFFLSITVIILVILVASIVLTKQKQESSKTSALF